MSDLASRLQALEDIEAVKQTMYHYWRCLDEKSSDEELREWIERKKASFPDSDT